MSGGMSLPSALFAVRINQSQAVWEYPAMAGTDRRKKIERRVQPDEIDEFSEHVRKVIGVSLWSYGERDTYLIEDVIQDTLLYLCMRDKLNPRASNNSYVRKVAKGRWLDLLEEDRRLDSFDAMPDDVKEARTAHCYPLRLSEQEVDVSLRQEEQQLSEKDRRTLKELREGKDDGCIAKESETTEQGVKQRRSRIKKRLGLATPKQRSKKAENQGS